MKNERKNSEKSVQSSSAQKEITPVTNNRKNHKNANCKGVIYSFMFKINEMWFKF